MLRARSNELRRLRVEWMYTFLDGEQKLKMTKAYSTVTLVIVSKFIIDIPLRAPSQ
jgi:hypothetical protein